MKKAIITLLLLICLPFQAVAQDEPLLTTKDVEARRAAIEGIAEQIDKKQNVDYFALREELRDIREESNSRLGLLTDRRDELQADVQSIGPVPSDGSEETGDISETRMRVVSAFNMVDESIRQSNLNIAYTNRLLDELADKRRTEFYDDILARGRSPLSPGIFYPAVDNFKRGYSEFAGMLAEAKAEREKAGGGPAPLTFLILSILAAIFLFWIVRRWAHRLAEKVADTTTAFRTAITGGRLLARVISGVAGGYIVYETATAQGFITPELQDIAMAIWGWFVAVIAIDSISSATLAPKRGELRLIPLKPASAVTLHVLVCLSAALVAFDAVLQEGVVMLGGVAELTSLHSGIIAVIGGALLFLICRKQLWELEEGQTTFSTDERQSLRLLRQGGQTVAFIAIAVTLFGYVALGHFIVTRVFYLSGILGMAWFLRSCVQALLSAVCKQMCENAAKADLIGKKEEPLVFFWAGLLVDIALILTLAPVIAIALGFSWIEVRDWMNDLFFGFQIGSVTVSVAGILTAIAAFALILFVTRLIQRGVDKRVFAKTHVDDGVRDSIRTLIGYVGLTIAVLGMLSTLGVKLANLAIIAGALSVGIGFGLQGIANNFISGLILLFERPVKVGDWIIVASGEGIVKKINVRSTEIETFDRSSIIIPNSELIGAAVTNWTHSDEYVRVVVSVGVSYSEQPEEIIKILNAVMNDNRLVVSWPQPTVYFNNFGDSSLDFQMRVFIRNFNDRVDVENQLRSAVVDAFHDAGVEIPFPQRDLHLRSTPEPAIAVT